MGYSPWGHKRVRLNNNVGKCTWGTGLFPFASGSSSVWGVRGRQRLKEKPAGSQAGKGFVKALELSAKLSEDKGRDQTKALT